MKTIFIATVTNEYGTDVIADETEAGAKQVVYDYVRCYWHEVFDYEPIPADQQIAIERYFSPEEGYGDRGSKSEYYRIRAVLVFDRAYKGKP